MRFAQKPIKVKDLSTLLYVHNGGKVNKEKIDDYIENLIEHEFLISELRFSMRVLESLKFLMFVGEAA